MKNQHMVAVGILVAVTAWMVIPRGNDSIEESSQTPQRQVAAVSEGGSPAENPNTMTVRARRVSQETYVERIRVRGRTEAFRHVQVRAEQAGRIISEPVPRGARVSAGDVLCEIAVDDRDDSLAEAIARRDQAQMEYEASVDLQRRDLQSEIAVSQLKAAVESAQTAVTRAELALANTRMLAPYDGVVETRTVEVGDLLNVGDVCASVLDNEPMLLIGLVPEQQVDRVEVGARVQGELLGGQRISGTVTFLASSADPISRSYRMEVTVDPGKTQIRSGITTEMQVDSDELQAHRIPPSALSLDDAGEIGVKLIDSNNEVYFQNVSIIGDETNQIDPGIWVTGLNGSVTLITLGQEIVFPGQRVDANFEWAEQRTAQR